MDKDVHTEHCCIWHGCCYGSEDCTVKSENKKQSYPCEQCEYDAEQLRLMRNMNSIYVDYLDRVFND